MPLYDYKCAQHGVFHELATMAEAGMPCRCPQCSELSPRIIMIPPQVLAMAEEKRKAMARNEKAAHEPIVTTSSLREARAKERDKAQQDSRRKSGGGCGCDHHDAQSGLRKQVVYLADGSKVFPSQRPWMISH
ncbi:FmdB family zinc ribbon protein [Allohahella marinimesophila]|uniref:Zinc ribbon domain-containing protein n=1 Tax=Allohahella marinimesophila TaxID=1054972 RepID=A0ABP7NII0_9GAMM